MNQENNNWNQNDFNTQGNNGIPNNQPLNNQTLNQGVDVNLQIINSQPQPIPNFQQPITQELTPQPTNSFISANVNNQSINNKPSKKFNFGLIIGGAIAVAIIVVGVIMVPKLFNNNSNSTNNEAGLNSEDNFNSVIKEGTAELAMTSKKVIKNYVEGMIYYKQYEYFVTKNSKDEFIIVDSKGKQVLPINNKPLRDGSLCNSYDECLNSCKYLGDGYFIYNTYTDDNKPTAIVVKDGNLIVSLDSYFDDDGIDEVNIDECDYKNGILYAGIAEIDIKVVENYKTIAYDIKNKKELWKIDGTFADGYGLSDDFIRVETRLNQNDSGGFVKDPNPNTIVNYNGKKIVSGADLKPIDTTGIYEYDTHIYTSKANSYLELKNNDYIKVYDLNNNLKATISIKDTDTIDYTFYKLYYSGVFVINKCENHSCKEILYNENGKELIRASDITVESYPQIMTETYLLPKNFDLISTRDGETTACVLIKDGEVAGKYKDCQEAKSSYGLEHNYLLYTDSDGKDKIINLNNMKVMEAPIEGTSKPKISNQSPNGEYVVVNTGENYCVYDGEFNLKYKSADWVTPINDKYLLTEISSTENEDNVMGLINIETGKVNKFNVKGNFYSRNAKGLVTYDGTNYYLYTFK